MKCPNCGFNSFDYLEECKKCKLPLNPSEEYKSRYKRQGNKAEPQPRESPHGSKHSEADLERNVPETEYALVSDQEGPAYYKREDNVDQHLSERTPSVQIHHEEPYTNEPELSPEQSYDSEFEKYPEDPLLYSESLEEEQATNLSESSETTSEEDESYSIAGLKLRAAAFSIDVLIVGVITYITIQAGFYFLEEQGIKPQELDRVFLPIYALLFFLASTYFIFLHYYAGRTIGKMALGIKLISADGREIGLWESFMRWVGYYISAVFFFAGFVWSIFDPDSQAWHDKIAGTYVVIG